MAKILDIKQLQTATRILERIKNIERDIVKMEKIAFDISEGKCDGELTLQFMYPEEIEQHQQEPVETPIWDSYLRGIDLYLSSPSIPKVSPKHSLNFQLTETLSYKIFALILKEKQLERTIINKIE